MKSLSRNVAWNAALDYGGIAFYSSIVYVTLLLSYLSKGVSWAAKKSEAFSIVSKEWAESKLAEFKSDGSVLGKGPERTSADSPNRELPEVSQAKIVEPDPLESQSDGSSSTNSKGAGVPSSVSTPKEELEESLERYDTPLDPTADSDSEAKVTPKTDGSDRSTTTDAA